MPESKWEDKREKEEMTSGTVGNDKVHLAFIYFLKPFAEPSGGSFMNICKKSSSGKFTF